MFECFLSRLLLSRIPLQVSFSVCWLVDISQQSCSQLVGFVDFSPGVFHHLACVCWIVELSESSIHHVGVCWFPARTWLLTSFLDLLIPPPGVLCIIISGLLVSRTSRGLLTDVFGLVWVGPFQKLLRRQLFTYFTKRRGESEIRTRDPLIVKQVR